MTKKNAKICVGTRVESMEEAIGIMQGEIGELNGEFTSLKECLQKILQNQQEVTRSAVLSGKATPSREASPSSPPFPSSESNMGELTSRSEHRHRRLEMPVFTGENLNKWLLRA